MSLAVSLVPSHAFADSRAALSKHSRHLIAQSNGNYDQRFMDERRNAQARDERSDEHADERSEVRISRDQAASIARDAVGGRVLKVELKGKRYHVKLLLDGERVRTVRVDATTGQVR